MDRRQRQENLRIQGEPSLHTELVPGQLSLGSEGNYQKHTAGEMYLNKMEGIY